MILPMLCKSIAKSGDAVNPNVLPETLMNLVKDSNYIWERKYNGIRAIVTVKDGKMVSIQARSGVEKIHLFPDIEIETKRDGVFDGEIQARNGVFNDIQHRMNRNEATEDVLRDYPAELQVYDILSVGKNEKNLMGIPLAIRKGELKSIIVDTESCKVAEYSHDALKLIQTAKDKVWEGVIGKNLKSTYQPNARNSNWIKWKIWSKAIVWVVGYTFGTGKRQSNYGALILGRLVNGKWEHLGDSGSGLDDNGIENIYFRMSISTISQPYFKYGSPCVWTKPFPIKVCFLEFTKDHKLVMAVFQGYPESGDEKVWKPL